MLVYKNSNHTLIKETTNFLTSVLMHGALYKEIGHLCIINHDLFWIPLYTGT